MKKLLISILILLSLALGVSAAGDITVTPVSSQTFAANVSETITGTFTIQNTNTTDSVTISLPSTIDFIGATTNQTSVSVSYNVSNSHSLANSTTESVNYSITVPAGAKNEAFQGTLNITAGAGNYDSFVITLNVNAAPAMTIADAAVTVAEGNSNKGSFTITNTGNSDLAVTFAATDLIGSSQNISSLNVVMDPNPTTLNYGESRDINFTITAPANSTGSYSGKIMATHNGGQINNTLTATVEAVNEAIQITESISKAVIVRTSSQDATTTLKIKNSGNVALSSVSFTATDLAKDANTTIASSYITVNGGSSVSLAVGEEKNITIAITPQVSYIDGDYTGNITINYGAGKSHTESYSAEVRSAGAFIGVPAEVNLGSESGEERGKNVTTSFTLSNAGSAGDSSLTGITVSSTASSDYKIEFSKDNSNFYSTLDVGSLLVGGSQTIYVKGYIPLDQDSGSDMDIGNIEIRSNEANATITKFYLSTEMMLRIEDLDISVESETHSNMDNGDTVKHEAKPGDKVEIDLKIENLFSSSSDIDIDDVSVKVTVEGIDDEDDIELESSEFSINSGKSKTVDLEFTVPYKVDTSSYDIVIEVEGRDDERADHEVTWTVKLPVEKETHKLMITKAAFGQSTVECIRSTSFSVKVLNIGDRKENEGVIEVIGPDFKIDDEIDFEFDNRIDEDDIEFSKTYSIDARDMKPGTYKITVMAYYAEDDLSDKSVAELVVKDCAADGIQVEQDEEDSEAIILEQKAEDIMEDGGAVGQEIGEDGEERSFKQSGGYTFLLIFGNLVVIAVAVFLVFKYLIAPQKEE